MNLSELREKIKNGEYNTVFEELYGNADTGARRAMAIIDRFEGLFGDREGVALFSSPARVELVGNHTDHAGGRAVAATITQDILAVAAPEKGRVELYGVNCINIELDGRECHEEERGTNTAFARGMAERFGGGFVCVLDNRIPEGIGMASSAAFALLCGKICDSFYSAMKSDPMRLALIGAEIENVCYGKPCGTLDHVTIAYGGTSYISFNTLIPIVKQIELNLKDYQFYLVNTGETHVDKSQLYKGIVDDMRVAASFFGCNMLGIVPPEEFKERGEVLKHRHGERVYRRALHFFDENKRVDFFAKTAAAGKQDMALYSINGSGISSRSNLGNVHQRAVEATAALKDVAAAVRIHGGGFGGAILCAVKLGKKGDFSRAMQAIFGANCIIPLQIRGTGVRQL